MACASNANGARGSKRSRALSQVFCTRRAVGEVGGRQQPDGLLPVAGKRLLRQVVGVDRRDPFERAAVLVERRIVIVDAGQDFGGIPKIEFLTLSRGVIDHVCRSASL